MKLLWMKEILGEAYTEELDAGVCQAVGERFIPRADFNEKNNRLKELEAQAAQLTESLKTRDRQLEELKKSAGAGEELKRQIEALAQQNKEQKAAYDRELKNLQLMAAVDGELTAAGARNNTAVKAVLGDFLQAARLEDGKILAKVGEENITLAARLEALKKDASTDFLFAPAARYQGWKPGESGEAGKPGGDKRPGEMSYSQLAEYLAQNPDAKLED